MILSDGGVWDIDISSAIQQCLNVVDDESDIIVDIAICGDKTLNQTEAVSKNALSNMAISRQINKFYGLGNSIGS